MDIDFHFSTIYVLSRWAGFDSDEAKIIAVSSQLVDDNISDKVPQFSNFMQRYSGHELWENLNVFDNAEVWVPFHFLPALDGDDISQQLVCRKNSTTAKALAESMLQYSGANQLFRLGIALHVYADTWAHQEFSGITDAGNTLLGLECNPRPKIGWQRLESHFAAATNLKPLGHAAALHCPDQPYLFWRSDQKFPKGRYNAEEFVEASKSIYRILQSVVNAKTRELSGNQEILLQNTFKEIRDEDCKVRNDEWIRRIQMGSFEFDELTPEDQVLEYSSGFILADEDYPALFYQGIEEHFSWVEALLREKNIELTALIDI